MIADSDTPAAARPQDPGVDVWVSPAAVGETRPPRRSPPRRALLVRLESRRLRLLVLALTLAGAAWLCKTIVSPAIGDYLASRAATIADLERALAWDPQNPLLHLRLAATHLGAFDGDLEKAGVQLEKALRQRPTHSGTWFQFALLADRRGQAARAREALDNALRLDRHNVDLRWEAALLLLRWGEREPAVEHLRYVIAVDPARRDGAFQLASALLPPGQSATSLMPMEVEALTGLLAGAVRRGDLALAQAAWEQRAPLSPAIPDVLQRRYLDLLLSEGQGTAARRLWLAMAPSGQAGAGGDLMWNGGFEAERIAGWGLDWQIHRIWGVEVSLDRFNAARGRQSLRLSFNSYPTLDFAGVVQPVPVQSGRQYLLRAMAKALDFNTASGVKLQATTPDDEVLGETRAVSGTTADWVALEARIRVPADMTLVLVRVRREKAPGPEANLAGKVWLDEVSLTPAGSVRIISAPSGGSEG